jgi:D-arginine dehydrogenase
MQDSVFDVAVIGAGMAGASVAAELAATTRVALLEMETQPGYHTTGRSAAIYAPFYGPPPIRALTRASYEFLNTPPQDFTAHPLLTPIEAVFVARPDQQASLTAMTSELADAPGVRPVDQNWLATHTPLLKPGYATAGLLDSDTCEIDVAALHQGYLRAFRAQGGTVMTRAQATTLTRRDSLWHIATPQGDIRAQTIINAAGAWADRVGALARAGQIGLRPLRRTALMVASPPGFDLTGMPMVIDIDEEFYLKPDAGKLLISPANEDPDLPSDVQPDEMDIALCIHRIETAFQMQVQKIENRWAGLRSFVADKAPVAGFSDQADRFYWLAGQGGYGIQSAPALSRFAAAQVLGNALPQDILDAGLDPVALSPARL